MPQNPDVKRYRYGHLAKTLFDSGEKDLAFGALEKLAVDLGIQDLARGLLDGIIEGGDKSIKGAAETYSEKYREALDTLDMPDLYDNYDHLINLYLQNQTDKDSLKQKFQRFKGTTFGNVRKDFENAVYRLNDPDNNFSQTQKDRAKQTVKKYDEILKIISMMERAAAESLRKGSCDEYFRKAFEEVAQS